ALGTGTGRAFRGTGQGFAIGGAVDNHLQIVRRDEAVGWCREGSLDRLYEIRGDDDDELGLAFLETLRAEELAKDRDVADTGYLGDVLRRGVLSQSGEREALATAQLD